MHLLLVKLMAPSQLHPVQESTGRFGMLQVTKVLVQKKYRVQAGQLNRVQAGQLNHVQAGQLNHVQAGQLNHIQTCQQAKLYVFNVCTVLHQLESLATVISLTFYFGFMQNQVHMFIEMFHNDGQVSVDVDE